VSRASSNGFRTVTPWDAIAHASRVESAARRWEIAHRGFGDAWYRLGWSEGATATSALQAWIEDDGRTILRGTYGVRSPSGPGWQLFRVDQSGTVYPSDVRVKGELEAADGSG
jgi:hypothetical protein